MATKVTTQSRGGSGSEWLRRADGLARRVNFGWCFDQLALAVPLAGVLATAAVLFSRAAGLADLWVYAFAIVPLVVAGVISWRRAKRHFIGQREALVRLESSLDLDSALSSASQGIGRWPELAPLDQPVLRWRWGRSFVPLILCLALVVTAMLWPLPQSVLAGNRSAPKPRNVQALEKVLEKLREEPLVAQEDLATLERDLGKLGKNPGALYKPSNLEAADHLAKRTAEALSNLADSSATASRALQGALDPNKGAKARAEQAEKLEEAIKKMANGAMKADPKLRDALKDAAGKAMKDLDPGAAQQLQDMLKENQEKFEEMLNDLAPDLMPGMGDQPGEGEPDPDGPPGGDGPDDGDAPPTPLRFHGNERGVEGGKLESLAPNPEAAAIPGELLELRAVKPPDPDAPAGAEAAGRPSTEAGGGARLWQENLDPDEQRFLGEFYK